MRFQKKRRRSQFVAHLKWYQIIGFGLHEIRSTKKRNNSKLFEKEF